MIASQYTAARATNRNRFVPGFTLIEVLVVVAIIALLISILLPSLAAARQQARIVMCATNLRTCMQGTIFYAQASKDDMPAGYMWDPKTHKPVEPPTASANPWEFLHPWIAKVSSRKGTKIDGGTGYTLKFPFYSCPDDKAQHTTNQRETLTPDGWRDFEVALSYNSNLNVIVEEMPDGKRFTSRKMSSMKNASRLVVYFDGGDDGSKTLYGEPPNKVTDSWITNDCKATWGENQCFVELRHRTGNNFVYLDTHVDFSKMSNRGPYYGLPPFPISWIPNWTRGGNFPAWVTNFTAFGPPQPAPYNYPGRK